MDDRVRSAVLCLAESLFINANLENRILVLTLIARTVCVCCIDDSGNPNFRMVPGIGMHSEKRVNIKRRATGMTQVNGARYGAR